jgi:hypothetical protein
VLRISKILAQGDREKIKANVGNEAHLSLFELGWLSGDLFYTYCLPKCQGHDKDTQLCNTEDTACEMRANPSALGSLLIWAILRRSRLAVGEISAGWKWG